MFIEYVSYYYIFIYIHYITIVTAPVNEQALALY